MSARLALGTLLLLGLSFAGAGIAHGVGVEMLGRPDLARGIAAAVVVSGAGLIAGGITTTILAHRRPWQAGLTIALGIMFAAAILLASDLTASMRTQALVMATAAAIGLVAFLSATPTAWFLRFLGRFDHLLPWRAR